MNKILVWKMVTKENQAERKIKVRCQFCRQEVRGVIRILVKASELPYVTTGSIKIQPRVLVKDDPVKSKCMGCHYSANVNLKAVVKEARKGT